MSNNYVVMVLTEPTEGQDESFNDYYENQHLEEVLQTTNFTSAQRFKLAGSAGEDSPLPYLAVYETTANSADDVLEDLAARRKDRVQSDALNRRTGRAWVFEATGPKHTSEG
ncbi:MAG: hypothetical protein ACI9ON_004267 [Limisphaerales bacterium]|jgi:hypothetical protein